MPACDAIRCVLAAAVAGILVATAAQAKTERSPSQVAAFKRHNPCPATGKKTGPCPGYVVDHIEPLCSGGPDHPSNMQWQTTPEAKIKDREERKQCRRKF